MSDNSNGTNPADIITYVGVPLAVLGVLPIMYNTVATLVSLSRIKRMLRHSQLTALTRSDVVNRVIEIELPRYAVTPLDRFQNHSEYWTVSLHPSAIPGGSWTTFHWRTNAIGMKTQRVEYADQVRQPQVEVAFDELISYLLDLGAVPDAHGWKLLRSTGLWAPVGCALMMSPDGREKALTIAPSDDSDGHLSLAVSWSSSWITRDYSHLPPYWVRLPPAPEEPKQDEAGEGSAGDAPKEQEPATLKEENGDFQKAEQSGSKNPDAIELDSLDQEGRSNAKRAITCQISIDGIMTALSQDDHPLAHNSTARLDSLYIEHVRIRPGKSDGVWFASAATAYGTSNQTILWNYKIPDDILSFARKETVPCGVLVLLNVVDQSETPEWATKYDDGVAHLDQFVRRNNEQRAAMAAEARMGTAQREQAVRDRVQREMNERMQDMRDKMRLDNQRREQRMMEALQSPKWDTKLVAERNLQWLKARGVWAKDLTLKDVVGFILHRMVLDGEFASQICRVLDAWRAWADVGGMKRADYHTIRDDQTVFANATLLMAMVKGTSTALDGTLAMDLQDCMQMWRKVRLG